MEVREREKERENNKLKNVQEENIDRKVNLRRLRCKEQRV